MNHPCASAFARTHAFPPKTILLQCLTDSKPQRRPSLRCRAARGHSPPYGRPRRRRRRLPASAGRDNGAAPDRSEEHTSELQSLMRISYAVFCLKKKTQQVTARKINTHTQKCNLTTEDTL